MSVRFFVVCFFLIAPVSIQLLLGQTTTPVEIKIDTVTGGAIGDQNTTLTDLKARALANAKSKAIIQAGVSERITRFEDYYVSESNNNEFQDLFTSNTISELRGDVKDVELLNENVGFNEFGNLEAKVTISCTVVKFTTEKDYSLIADVKGLKKVYNVGDKLSFSFRPLSDLYLTIFWMGDSQAGILFPNENEVSTMFLERVDYQLPSKSYIDYEITSDQETEVNRLIFIYLKEDRPYLDKVEYDNITDWLLQIPFEKRNVETFSFITIDE